MSSSGPSPSLANINSISSNLDVAGFPHPPIPSIAPKPQARVLVIKSASSRQRAHGWSSASRGLPMRRIGSSGSSSSVSNTSIWDRLADEVIAQKSAADANGNSEFPTLGASSSSSVENHGQQQQQRTLSSQRPTFVETAAKPHITSAVSYPPLSITSASSSVAQSRSTSTPATVQHTSNGSNKRDDLFPALAKSGSTGSLSGMGSGSVNNAATVWGQSSPTEDIQDSTPTSSKKKKGREKHVLLHFG